MLFSIFNTGIYCFLVNHNIWNIFYAANLYLLPVIHIDILFTDIKTGNFQSTRFKFISTCVQHHFAVPVIIISGDNRVFRCNNFTILNSYRQKIANFLSNKWQKIIEHNFCFACIISRHNY